MDKKKRIKELEEELSRLKNDNDVSVLDKYIGRYLYFEGDESGSVIINIDKINYDFTFDGIVIDLATENSQCGGGVNCNAVHSESFENLPYYQNGYDFEDECIDEDGDLNECKYLDYWLSYGKYGEPLTTKTSRVIPVDKVKEVIDKHLCWYLPTDITGTEDSYLDN